MKTRDIKTKNPWKRISARGYMNHGVESIDVSMNAPIDMPFYRIVTQADFLRELHPSGHAINSDVYYPDIWKEEEYEIEDENGQKTGKKGRRLYKELVPRYAFAFQRVILVKQLVHLCGNDIQFDINTENPTEQQESVFNQIRKGWLTKNVEVGFY